MSEGGEKSSFATKAGIGLAVLTIVVSIVNGIPAFLALQGKEPYVVYETNNSSMLYPTGSNRQAIHDLLSDKNIPDAFGTVLISNRGDIPAKEIAITISVPGTIVAENTDPNEDSKPAWVAISKDFDPSKDKSKIRYTLKEVGLNRNFKINVSYISEPYGNISWDVFYDGKPAVKINSIATIPENARSISFRPTLLILGIGLILSLLVFLAIRIRTTEVWSLLRNSRLALHEGRLVLVRRESYRYRDYRNNLVFELGKDKKSVLVSIADGDPSSQDPQGFWDGIIEISERKIALDVHSSDQQFFRSERRRKDFALRVVSMAVRTPDLFAVAVINEEDCWSEGDGNEFLKLVTLMNHSEIKFFFLSGDVSCVAESLSLSTRLPRASAEFNGKR